MGRRGLTLGRALGILLAALAAAVGLLLWLLLARWGDSLLAASERQREGASRRAEALVARTLEGAEASLGEVQDQVAIGLLRVADALSVEGALLGVLQRNPDLAEATLTGARTTGAGPEAPLAPGSRWQVSVWREAGDAPRLLTRRLSEAAGGFVVNLRRRPPGQPGLLAAPLLRGTGTAEDPTRHPTFASTVQHRRFSPDALWTDLHHAEVDEDRPESGRRVVVSVMRVLEGGAEGFLGVIRVGMLAARLDEVARLRVDETARHDPHRIFVADARGRPVTRLEPDQPLEDLDGDLRPASGTLPAEVRAALASPALREVEAARPRASARLNAAGRTFLLSALFLRGAQDWRVGIVVPEDHYLGDLKRVRRMLVTATLVTFGGALLLCAAGLRSVQASLARMVGSTGRMRDFDFAAVPARSPFTDVRRVLEDLEQAKTALRALGKYVPVDLVRQLYRAREEPRLGGELRDLTLMFTDIEGFTSLAERLAPATLAQALGRYLEAMTAAIHASGGTVDKYIGDAVMALWNAPAPRDGHPVRACQAALACLAAGRALAEGPEWSGLPPFRTRFGLHREEVMVGHFGAPDRMSYTALGDGVNLAARLEGLNKAYGTRILVSRAVRDAAGAAFAFRLVDKVAVKGKGRSVTVFELLGPVSADAAPHVVRYEQAFASYQERRFAEAVELLAAQPDDPPSRVLAARCRRHLCAPPPEDWDGTHAAEEK
jgi:adenylate cyclase